MQITDGGGFVTMTGGLRRVNHNDLQTVRQWIKPSLNANYRRGVRHNDRGANHNAQLLWYALGGLIPTIKLL